MNILTAKWPFVINAAALIVLVMLGLYLFDAEPCFAGAFQKLSGYAGGAVEKSSMPEQPPPLDWTLGIVLGVLIGGVSGGLLNKSWKCVSAFEEETKFGWKLLKTALLGTGSGFLIMLGCLLSGEVFAGQFAGAMELSPGAWMFLIIAFFCAGATAVFLERTREGGGKTGGNGAGTSGGEA